MSASSSSLGSVAQTLRSHVSAFQKLRPTPPVKARLVDGSMGVLTPSMEAAYAASIGAAWFVGIAQVTLVVTVFLFGRPELLGGIAWSLPCFVFNAVFIYCWRSDPGVVRRGEGAPNDGGRSPGTEVIVVVAPPDDVDAARVGAVRARHSNGPTFTDPAVDTVKSTEPQRNQDGIPLRWCDDCAHWQPLRTRHCDKCNVCVRKFDHHCFWVGGCVGERNHGKFVLVLATATWYVFVCWWVVMFCFDFRVKIISPATRQVLEQRSTLAVALRNFLPVILFLTALLLLMFVVSLLMWHTVLVFTNQTTWESASSSRISYFDFTKHHAPFDHGPLQNLRSVFCIRDHHAAAVWRFAPGRQLPVSKRVASQAPATDTDPLTIA